MANPKTLFLLLISFLIFTTGSPAQEKKPAVEPAVTVEPSDRVNPQTKRFESKAGNFSIDISAAPFQTRILDPEEGRAPGKHFFWQFEKIVYTVMYSPFNKKDLAQAFTDMTSGIRKSISRMEGQFVSEKEISFGEFPGKEFIYIPPNKTKYVVRTYLVGDTGYLLTALFVDEQSEKEALEVLASFQLLTEKK